MNNNHGCQACFRQFTLANYDKLKEYKETVIDKKSSEEVAIEADLASKSDTWFLIKNIV